MNSSKNIVSGQEKESKRGVASVPEKKLKKGSGIGGGGNLKPIILIGLCVVVILALCIGVAIQQFKPKVVVTVDKEKLTMSDMMYPIYEVESQYAPYNEMYMAYMGTSFWESDYQGSSGTTASGITNSIGLKQEIINREVQYEIISKLAEKAGYKLSADDKKEAEKKAEKALKGLSWLQKFQLDFSKSKLTSLFEKRALAEKYRDDKQEELNKDVDEDAAIKDISKKDYRQYDVQYYYAATNETDDEGNSAPVGADKKKLLEQKIKTIAKKAQTEKDFTKLSEEDDEDVTFEEEGSFTEKDGFTYLSDDNLKKLKKMKKDEIQAFYDEKAGYYIVVKMLNNNSEEAYKTACDDAIKAKQDEAFNNWYTEEEQNHKININTDIWTDVTIGSVTTDIVTAEDLNDMQEDSSDASSNGSN